MGPYRASVPSRCPRAQNTKHATPTPVPQRTGPCRPRWGSGERARQQARRRLACRPTGTGSRSCPNRHSAATRPSFWWHSPCAAASTQPGSNQCNATAAARHTPLGHAAPFGWRVGGGGRCWPRCACARPLLCCLLPLLTLRLLRSQRLQAEAAAGMSYACSLTTASLRAALPLRGRTATAAQVLRCSTGLAHTDPGRRWRRTHR